MNSILTYVAKKQLLKKSDTQEAYICVWKSSLRNTHDAGHHCLLSFKSNVLPSIFDTVYESFLHRFTFAQNLSIKVSFVSADLSAVFKSKI